MPRNQRQEAPKTIRNFFSSAR